VTGAVTAHDELTRFRYQGVAVRSVSKSSEQRILTVSTSTDLCVLVRATFPLASLQPMMRQMYKL